MNILDEIVANKLSEVASLKDACPTMQLEQSIFFSRQTVSLCSYVLRADKTGIIAEFKRRSPSKGMINENASVEQITTGYVTAGASALSVLTDKKFFSGDNTDLKAARSANSCPIIRKDFTIDEYQVIEAKSIGADAILLIAAILKPGEIKSLTKFAHSFGLEVLLEVHDEHELNVNLESGADLIGVNNRNLKTFAVNIDTSKMLAGLIPDTVVKVSESGISSVENILKLRKFGYQGFLIGENFMKASRPDEAAKVFMNQLMIAK
jgi:indole-3-glycerol phosphate synthase